MYGLVTHILAAGVIRRDKRAIAASLLVHFLYGASAWGVLPIVPRGFLGNPPRGRADRSRTGDRAAAPDIPPRRRYAWEDEPVEPEGE